MKRGKELNQSEIKDLNVGSYVWIYWAKDDNPEYVRFNDVFVIEEKSEDGFIADGEKWPYDGDTSRGYAYYYEIL